MEDYPRFADFSEEDKPFDGDKKKIDDVLGKDILLVDFKIKPSKQDKGTFYTTIQFKINDISHIVFTGSSVLADQLEKYRDKLPFYSKIKKINKYYSLT